MSNTSKESRRLETRAWLPVVLLCALLPATGWGQEFTPDPGTWNVPLRLGSMGARHFGGALQVQTTMTRDGYYARVHARGIRPEDIRVYPRHGYLIIEADKGDRYGTARTGVRSESHWQMHLRRQLRLPYDADVSGMTRRTGNGIIEIFLPFR